METAKALALAGYDIVFVDRPGKQGERVADILMDGDTWEMKSPRSDSLKAIEGNVKRARNQSPCVVLDSRRMRKVPDAAIERELRRCAKTIKGIRRLLFVGRHGGITTILRICGMIAPANARTVRSLPSSGVFLLLPLV